MNIIMKATTHLRMSRAMKAEPQAKKAMHTINEGMLAKKRVLFASIILSACTVFSSTAVLAQEQVNVYSARKEALIKPILDIFTEKTGVQVNLITGKADALLTRLRLEGKASPADVFITVDAGRLHRAKAAKVLQPIQSEVLAKRIPDNLRDPDGYWFGLSQRARPIFYAKSRVNPSELSTYEALAEPQWKGRVCMRSSNNVYNQSLVASMLHAEGEEATSAWLAKLVKNFAKPPAGGDIDQLKSLVAGQCDVTVANTYYYGRLVNHKLDENSELAKQVGLFWPNQNDRGAHVNVSGAGVTAYARHIDNAKQLIEFLASDEAQAWYSAVNNEYPTVTGAVIAPTLKAWGEFTQDTVDLSVLGEKNRSAVELMDRARWK